MQVTFSWVGMQVGAENLPGELQLSELIFLELQ